MADGPIDEALTVPQGTFSLRRHGRSGSEPLRAWDAGDEYVLHEIAERGLTGRRWIVADDAFGALAVVLAASGDPVVAWSDSHVTSLATTDNLARNRLPESAVEMVATTSSPTGPFDGAIVKIPRAKAHLDDLLRRLRGQLAPDAVVIGAGMTKAVHQSTIDSFESHLGPTPTTRARKKARLLLPEIDPALTTSADPAPVRHEWDAPGGLTVTAMPNVFSATGLDAGTRLLLDHLPDMVDVERAVDLGCGTGVIAASLATQNSDIEVICCDESHEAVASARETVGRVTDRAQFLVTDVLDGLEDRSVDLVVVNPPFHAGGARTNAVAKRMFIEARRVLRPGGELRVVGNRHLPHHVTLKRVFGAADVVASNPQFVVLSARRSSER